MLSGDMIRERLRWSPCTLSASAGVNPSASRLVAPHAFGHRWLKVTSGPRGRSAGIVPGMPRDSKLPLRRVHLVMCGTMQNGELVRQGGRFGAEPNEEAPCAPRRHAALPRARAV